MIFTEGLLKEIKTEKDEDDIPGIKTESVDMKTDAEHTKREMHNENNDDSKKEIKTEKDDDEVKTKNNGNEKNQIKTEIDDNEVTQNEKTQVKRIKKELGDPMPDLSVNNSSAKVDVNADQNDTTIKDIKSEMGGSTTNLNRSNNASLVDIDRGNGETGRVRVKLEGGGDFQEGQIYVGRTRKGEIKQMAWKGRKLVELSSIPMTSGKCYFLLK